jgi:serine/threonine-protein kinase
VAEAWDALTGACAVAAVLALMVWILYLALEPLVRRNRPESMVAWTRLLSGRWRDPLVGRDLLIGSTFGAAILLIGGLERWAPPLLGLPAPLPQFGDPRALLGLHRVFSASLETVVAAALLAMLMMFFFALGSLQGGVRRKNRIGLAIFYVISLVLFALSVDAPSLAVVAPFALVSAGLYTLLFARYGLVAGIAMALVLQWRLPLALDLSTWFAGTTIASLALMAALPVFGFYCALAGRGPFGEPRG